MSSLQLTLERIAEVNPVSLAAAHEFGERVRLDEQIQQRLAWDRSLFREQQSTPVRRGLGRTRTVVLACLATAAVVLTVSPAFGMLKDSVLPFLGLEQAPRSVQLEFDSLSVGAPAGMDPRAIGDDTRKVTVANFGGAQHTLWVAPTRAGGFCYMWTPGYGGCNTDAAATLDALGPAVAPAGTVVPTVPPNASEAEKDAAVRAGFELATITPWLVGFVDSHATAVRVRFSDGTTRPAAITQVSEPIDAGFFAYDAPSSEQTPSHHVIAVEALDTAGAVLATQPLPHAR